MDMKTVERGGVMEPQKRQIMNAAGASETDEINLLEYVHVLVKYKVLILGLAFLGFLGGYVAALVKGPTYVAEAVIEAKEGDKQSSSSSLSSLGALGGFVANQLNMAGSPGLDRISLILDSRKFNAELISKYDFLDDVYAQKWPDKHEEFYDKVEGKWSEQFVKPELLGVGKVLKENYLKKGVSQKTMSIKVESRDSLFSHTLLGNYLEYLNSYLIFRPM
ncbi:MAG: Wzz/FepE/Etk N-terminal domain-containing protein [Chitinispirillaceae bacterium]